MGTINGLSNIGIAFNNAITKAGEVFGNKNGVATLQEKLEEGIVFDIAGNEYIIKSEDIDNDGIKDLTGLPDNLEELQNAYLRGDIDGYMKNGWEGYNISDENGNSLKLFFDKNKDLSVIEMEIEGIDAFGIYNTNDFQNAIIENDLGVKMSYSVMINSNLKGDKETIANKSMVIVNGEDSNGTANGRSKQIFPHYNVVDDNGVIHIGNTDQNNHIPAFGQKYSDNSEINMN